MRVRQRRGRAAIVLAAALAGCTASEAAFRVVDDEDIARTRHEVPADDGHPLTVWAKRPERPRGSVVLLHGRTWSSVPDFDLQVEGEDLSLMDGLVERGFSVYALDARGYGGTPRDGSGWLTPDRMAADAATAVRWVDERDGVRAAPVLFGWSMGSTVAHLTAQRHPELVSGVVLFGYWRHPDARTPVTGLGEPERRPNTAEAAASDFITPNSISRAAVEAYVSASLEADPVRVDLGRMHEFDALSPDSLRVPVLLMQGELDPIAPDSVQAALFDRLAASDKEWVVLGGCDHAAFLERCRPRFLRSLAGFVDEVTGR